MAAIDRDGSNRSTESAPTADRRAADWAPLLVALVVPLLLLQVAVVRPTATQLARMRGQVARLEATIEQLRDREADAGRATGLLARLNEQADRLDDADESLERFADLERRIARSVARADRATATLDRLDAVVRGVERQAALLDDATDALATVAAAPSDLAVAIDQASRVAPKVTEVRQLADRLADAQGLADAVSDRVAHLIASQEALALDSARVATADETLDGLIQLEARLNAPLMAVGASHERLDELLRLKDAVLAHTDNLPEAFDTLELIAALQRDYQQASGVFRTVQGLLADLVLLEPSIARVAAVVEPMIDRAGIGALGGAELRLVLRELRQRHAAALANAPAGTEEPAVAGRPAAVK
ncbi:MAG: hypothetical protein AAF805_04175 [Planctomycetota bacterium]